MLTINQRGRGTLGATIGLAILLAIIFGGIYIFKKQNAEKQTPPQQAVQDETADWKTYSNIESGFSIKYPADWIAGRSSRDARHFYFRHAREGVPLDSPWADPELCDVCVTVYSDKSEADFQLQNSKPISLSGISGKQGIELGILNSYAIILAKNNLIYEIYSGFSEQPDATQLRIMQSFNFLK